MMSGKIADLVKGLSQARSASSKLQASLAAIRAEIAELVEERAALEGALVPAEEAERRVNAWVETLKQRAGAGMAAGFTHPVPHRPELYDNEIMLNLALAGAADGIRELFLEQQRRIYVEAGAGGLDVETRKARAAEIEAELLSLEAVEELSVRALEEAGIQTVRRADLSPAVAVATSASLEQVAA